MALTLLKTKVKAPILNLARDLLKTNRIKIENFNS